MKMVITTLAFVTAVAVATVNGYTYTNEEGKFAIDVPDGWKVDENPDKGRGVGGVNILAPWEPGIGPFGITIMFIKSGEPLGDSKWAEYSSIYEFHDDLIKVMENIKTDKYITGDEARDMNVDAGFIIEQVITGGGRFVAVFFKADRIYYLEGGGNKKVYDSGGRGKIVKALNSFRALD